MISLIVAVDAEFGIGKNGQIPWQYSEDMRHFARTTKGSTCIMGRITCEDIMAIHEGKSILPNRESLVVSSNASLECRDGTVVSSLQAGIDQASREETFIIGGAGLYRESLPYIDQVYITFIPSTHGCDVVIPDVIRYVVDNFKCIEQRTSDTGLEFTRAVRKEGK